MVLFSKPLASIQSRPAQVAGVVGRSAELERVAALPRRVVDLDDVLDLTDLFRRPGGTMRLLPLQSLALREAAEQGGLFAPLGVGRGKTLLSLLLPTAMESKCAVIMVPSKLLQKTLREAHDLYDKHFVIPFDVITFVTYEELSHPNTADALEKADPDLLICDESHKVALGKPKTRRSSRANRYDYFVDEHPSCRHVFMSGTATRRSVRDYAPHLELALKKGSPLARSYRDVMDWAGAIDPRPDYLMRPGALLKALRGPEEDGLPDGDAVRSAYRRRLVETPGVVASRADDVGASLVVRRLCPKAPAVIDKALGELRATWCVNGQVVADKKEITEASDMSATARQVATGFYYVWDWPGGVVDTDWLFARAAWRKAVGEKLAHPRPGLDSELLLRRAADRWLTGKKTGQAWECDAWPDWKAVMDRPEPPKRAIYLDDYLLELALARAQKSARDGVPAIVWYAYKAHEARLAQLSGLTPYGAGTDASASRDDVALCSQRTQGEGMNLQHHYAHNVFLILPLSGTDFEQVVGRTHRLGHRFDEVTVDWFGHVLELDRVLSGVIRDAKYKQETMQDQKALVARYIDEEDE